LHFNFALEYAIRKVQQNAKGFELDETHQLLVYADNFIILGKDKNTKNKNTGALLQASRDSNLEVNAEKTKYMFVSAPL
jgi:hypothetical protein